MKTWNAYQENIFSDVKSGKGHTVVMARAGTGKTTTIIEALKFVPKGKTSLLVAFNKTIADELGERCPRGVVVQTLHSYGLSAIRSRFKSCVIDAGGYNRSTGKYKPSKVAKLAIEIYGDDSDKFFIRETTEKVVSLAKGCLVPLGANRRESLNALDSLCDEFGLDDVPSDPEKRDTFLLNVYNILKTCLEWDGAIDFDDMIWLPVMMKLPLTRFDRVFVDETQDLNACQIELALGACKDNGRICAVGDDRQAIYRFRGAGENSIGDIVARLGAKVLPLSVTYRCASVIVDLAKEIVPDFECGATYEGIVRASNSEMMMTEAKPGDFVLSRTNAPLVKTCLAFIREGVRANVQGNDLGKQLKRFITKSKAKTVTALLAYTAKWSTEESARLAEKKRDVQPVYDRHDTIEVLCDGATSIDAVLLRIKSLFNDDDKSPRIILSSTHRAKGLERDRVFVLRDTYRKRDNVEEDNLYYVAVTRAKRELVFVSDKTEGVT